MSSIERSDSVDLEDGKFRTINSCDEKEQKEILSQFLTSNQGTLKKTIGIFFYFRLQKLFFFTLFTKDDEILILPKMLTTTRYKFSEGPLLIPHQLDLISEIIFSYPLNTKGLFRLSSTKSKIQIAFSMLYEILERPISKKQGIEMFRNTFSIIDCCVLYKEITRSFNNSIFPKNFLPLALSIADVKDKTEQLVCMKAIVLALPHRNRAILESLVFVSHKICEITKDSTNSHEQMNIQGMAIVMMPNIFLSASENVSYDNVLKLISFTQKLFKKFCEIIQIE